MEGYPSRENLRTNRRTTNNLIRCGSSPFHEKFREHLEGPNLLLLWDVTEEGVLDEVQLACPKGGDITRESIETHWIIRVSHSAEMIPGSQEWSLN